MHQTQLYEQWATIPDFPMYEISSQGRVRNAKFDRIMRTSINSSGHVKITLVDDHTGMRLTRSVAQMVAEAFVAAPTVLCDHVVVLDGNFENVRAENLVWRPRYFAWKYTHQLKNEQIHYFHNLRVQNISTGAAYDSIIQAGMCEGLLFQDIWRSTYSGARLFPHGDAFEVIS